MWVKPADNIDKDIPLHAASYYPNAVVAAILLTGIGRQLEEEAGEEKRC